MKKPFALLLALAPALFSACSDNDPEPQIISSPDPVGTLTSLRTGSITPQNGTPTRGTLALVRDAQNQEFVQLNADFTSDFHTGTVTVYLAKADTRIGTQRAAAGSNVQVVGLVNKNGQQFLRLGGSSTGFSHVVFYCETAAINFGAAPLQ
ncbi:DM13 domain-containing protein [Hymenobacter sp. NST-14]|uniref:DM13 domain-containing protein n=1 Tax=Hymenobacter piscis TaxID=2839984 RepID=UPI001C02017F|nr:DM13 domain-containing protein [Hymenobacter piscis]MBT9392508.1 DM13 domain-containing protein [Hymenobacter piscis]